MSDSKSQQKKLLSNEITRTFMEYMIGLDETNEHKMRDKLKKSSKEIVRLYSSAIKRQQKKVLQSQKKKEHKLPAWHEDINIIEQGKIIHAATHQYVEIASSMAS